MPDHKDPTPEEITAAAEKVAERVKEEGTDATATAPIIDHEFVRRCLYAGQKGDGILYAAVHKGNLLCAPELKNQWFEWTGSYWKQVTVYRAEALVEAVVAQYEEARLDAETKIAEAKQARDDESEKRLQKLSKRLRKNVDDLREGPGFQLRLDFPSPMTPPSLYAWKSLTPIPTSSA